MPTTSDRSSQHTWFMRSYWTVTLTPKMFRVLTSQCQQAGQIGIILSSLDDRDPILLGVRDTRVGLRFPCVCAFYA